MKSEHVYLHHILDAIQQIEVYVAEFNEAAFFESRLVQDAVTRQLEIIGEASRRLSDDFRASHDAIPWRAIIGMRNRIAHDYLNIDGASSGKWCIKTCRCSRNTLLCYGDRACEGTLGAAGQA